MGKNWIIILVQIVLVFAFITIITVLIKLDNAMKLEKRIARYSVKNSFIDENISIFDKFLIKYLSFVKKQRKKIKKLFPMLVNRYSKYSVGSKSHAEDFITHKIILSILFAILTIIALSIQGRIISFFELASSLLIGFYILDIYLVVMRIINRKKIENEMLRAIIVMNNAFKSGKSTIQAVEIASKKLPKPIGYEFNKIYEEMQYGLSFDTVFDRFSKRVRIEEAEYLSSSLTILNKTGGNIVAVFDSIEKTLFSKMKLKEELKSSTMVSKLVVVILFLVPIFFVLLVYILNPSYFDPFFKSTLGYVLVGIILLMFIIYSYFLYKIVKVDY